MTVRRRRAPRGSGEQLKDEIVDAATDLLMETGHAKAVSVRAVAHRAGVTSPSIYLHFADKDALIDAVCSRYFEKLDVQMQRAAGGQPSTLHVLQAQGLAYVRFALGNPELYRIATMGEGRPGSSVDLTLNSSAFVHLRASVAQLVEEGIFPPGDLTVATLELWAAVHGVAALLVAKPYLPWGDVEAFTVRALRTVALGHIASGMIGPTASAQDAIDWLSRVPYSDTGNSTRDS